MHAPLGLTDKWSLKMYAKNLCSETAIFLRLFAIANITRDPLEAVASFVERRSDCSCQHRGSSVTRDRLSDFVESLRGAFHNVMSTRAVDVDVHKSRHDSGTRSGIWRSIR